MTETEGGKNEMHVIPSSIINTVINEHGDQGSAPFMRRSRYRWRGKWWSVTFEGVRVCKCLRMCTPVPVSPAGLTYSAISHWWHPSWPNIKDFHRSNTTVASNTHAHTHVHTHKLTTLGLGLGLPQKSQPSKLSCASNTHNPTHFTSKEMHGVNMHAHTYLVLTWNRASWVVRPIDLWISLKSLAFSLSFLPFSVCLWLDKFLQL